jgi:RNA polymerase sigma-70 factor (ECF subfamily)
VQLRAVPAPTNAGRPEVEGIGRLWLAAPQAAWTVTVVNPDSECPEGQPDRRAALAPGEGPAVPGARDEELVAASVAGRREAFDELVTRHRRMVYRVCHRFTGNHEDASDLAQDVFVRAYRGLASFRGNSSVSTWLYRIAVNTALNHVGSRRPATDELDPGRHTDSTTPAPDDRVWQQQERARVRDAIRRLPDRQRATVILRVYHDLTHEEIARVLGSSVGTVKANFFHALRNLRGLLGEREPRS